jgi:hypothetical protein
LKKKTLHYSSVKSLFCIGLRPQAAVQALLIAQAIGGVGWWGVPLAVRSFLCQYLFLVIAFKKEASDASDLV